MITRTYELELFNHQVAGDKKEEVKRHGEENVERFSQNLQQRSTYSEPSLQENKLKTREEMEARTDFIIHFCKKT
jgi:hypothetical protein